MGLLGDPRRIELQLVGQMVTDKLENFVSRHGWSGTVAAGSSDTLQRPCTGKAIVGPARHVLPHAAGRDLDRAREPAAPERAVRHDAELAQSEQHGAALLLRVDLVAQRPQRRAQQPAAELSARGRIAASRTAPSSADDVALHDLQRDVAGEAVRDDHVRHPGADREALDVADEVQLAALVASCCVGGDDVSAPLVGSSPLESSATRGRSTPITTSMNAAPMWANWTRCSGRHLDVGAHVEQQDRGLGTGTTIASAGRWMPGARLKWNSAGGERGAGRAAGDERVGAALGDGLGGLDDRGLRRRRTARAGSGSLAIETGASTISTPSACRRSRRRARTAAPVSPVPPLARLRARPPRGPRSAPFASTATVTGLVVVIVVVRAGHVDHLTPPVAAAMRAHAVRPARLVALRAGVHDGAVILCCARRLLVRACDCFCFGTAMAGCEE